MHWLTFYRQYINKIKNYYECRVSFPLILCMEHILSDYVLLKRLCDKVSGKYNIGMNYLKIIPFGLVKSILVGWTLTITWLVQIYSDITFISMCRVLGISDCPPFFIPMASQSSNCEKLQIWQKKSALIQTGTNGKERKKCHQGLELGRGGY